MAMLTRDYLALCLNRLKSSDQWTSNGAGLAFILAKAGKGIYSSGADSQQIGPGDVVVIDTGSAGKLSARDGLELIFWCFSVQLEHLFPLFANEEIWILQDLQRRFKTIHVYPAVTPLAKDCHRLVAGAPPQFNLDHRSYLLRVAAAILSAELASARPQRDGYVGLEDHLNSVFEKLSTDEVLGLSVDELAARFSCSRRHLNRLFHHRFGLSVSALRMELRLLKAASLLRDAEAKIINVAEQCAFNHLGLFNTCFKRRFGMSPGQWRRHREARELPPGDGNAESQECRLRTSGLCPWCEDEDNHPPTGDSQADIRAPETRRLHPTPLLPRNRPAPAKVAVSSVGRIAPVRKQSFRD